MIIWHTGWEELWLSPIHRNSGPESKVQPCPSKVQPCPQDSWSKLFFSRIFQRDWSKAGFGKGSGLQTWRAFGRFWWAFTCLMMVVWLKLIELFCCKYFNYPKHQVWLPDPVTAQMQMMKNQIEQLQAELLYVKGDSSTPFEQLVRPSLIFFVYTLNAHRCGS